MGQSPASQDEEVLLEVRVVVYRRRWYILVVFSLLAMFQCTVWNTWGPVAEVAIQVYKDAGWSDSLVAWMANYGPIMAIAFFIPFLYLLSSLSLRWSVVISSFLMAAGCVLRCLFLPFPHLSDKMFTILCHICGAFNGIAGIVVCSAPAMVSAAWFPPDERVTATSIGQLFNGLGGGLGFFMAKQIVHPITNSSSNSSCQSSSNSSDSVQTTPEELGELRNELKTYMYSLAGPAVVLFLLSLLYFPSSPPNPPSLSSSHDRIDFFPSLRILAKNPAAWCITLAFAISNGLAGTFSAMIVSILTKIEYDHHCLNEDWVSGLAMVTSLVATVVAILVARITDKVRGKMKISLLVLLFAAGIDFTILSLISSQVIRLPSIGVLKIVIYILYMFGQCLITATCPLFLEFAVEVCYPVSEAVVGGFLFLLFNCTSMIFLFGFNLDVGSGWVNYVLPFCCFGAIPFILFVKEEYKRMEVDKMEKVEK